jgi:CDP-2,3-bis-(O-geranylgeranyl)-sn-glycerol synthase
MIPPGFWEGVRLLVLLAIANSAPIAVKHWAGSRWDWPLDAGLRLPDGRRLLGPSKTLRGVVSAVAATAAAGMLLGWPIAIGATVGTVAMLGDALSSFVKRRLDIAASGKCTGLDQVPESLLPLLALRASLGLSWATVLLVALAFFVLEVGTSPWWFRAGWRDRPY